MNFARSMAASVVAALALSAVFGFLGQPEDTFLFGFLLSLFYTVPFALLICPAAYLAAGTLAPTGRGEWVRRGFILLIGGMTCFVVALVLAFLSAPSDVSGTLMDNAKFAFAFQLTWLIYFAIVEI